MVSWFQDVPVLYEISAVRHAQIVLLTISSLTSLLPPQFLSLSTV